MQEEQSCLLGCLEQGEFGVKAGGFQMFPLKTSISVRHLFIVKEGGISRHWRAAGG